MDRQTPCRQIRRRQGFTISELLAVIAIIAALAALIFPIFASAKSAATGSVCLSNLHQIGIATNLYMTDADEHYPLIVNAFERKLTWFDGFGRSKGDDPSHYPDLNEALYPYAKSRTVFICPMDTGLKLADENYSPAFVLFNGGSSYLVAELFNGQTESTWKDPSRATWACDGNPAWHSPDFQGPDLGTYKVNAVFYDWHVALKLGDSPTFLE